MASRTFIAPVRREMQIIVLPPLCPPVFRRSSSANRA